MSAPLLPRLLSNTRSLIQKPSLFSLAKSSISSTSRPLRSTLNTRAFTSSTPKAGQTNTKMASTMSLLDATTNRRSIYALNKTSPISDARIEEIVTHVVKNTPSSFNSQSARLVLLLKDEHDKFWDVVRDILKAVVPEDKWESTGNRIAGFRAGYGTILFYEDPEPVKTLQTNLPMYADKFPVWSEHTSAMHQYAAWTALEAEGLGANLQHYNPLPDQKASEIWNIPLEWQLKAQLVFGGLQEGAREKLAERAEQPLGGRLFVHGK